MIELERSGICCRVDDETKAFSTNCQLRIKRAINSCSVTFVVNLWNITRVKLFRCKGNALLWTALDTTSRNDDVDRKPIQHRRRSCDRDIISKSLIMKDNCIIFELISIF